MRFLLLSCLFFWTAFSQGQRLIGKVIDSKTHEFISGASVYIDGTTIGVITDFNGDFNLSYPTNTDAKLVIRMMGYELLEFKNPLEVDLSNLQLIQKVNELDAVIIDPDPWTRTRKENYFKRYFLGGTELAKSCTIVNLDSVKLRFNPSTAILSARSRVPIKVENKELGYLIEVDVELFDMHFNKLDSLRIKILDKSRPFLFSLSPFLTEGATTSKFNELYSKERKLNRSIRKRRKFYPLSSLYFYRSLCADSLDSAGFQIFYDNRKVETREHIRVRKKGEFYKISFRNKVYTIIDSNKNKSRIAPLSQTIFINNKGKSVGEDGIATNKGSLLFQGYFAQLGKSGLLPSDYSPND
ncbi:carboxypeptidase-like regulatory domain-containing protein [Nonlabens sp. Ci31]|uniref:carboxypeptidase-like regulatory domain-containing protein n=1 Tax=Nonlabens sp. Ci31 TaxID=2608253 RepID=UPI001462C6A3|nr:carboxypeptidase-like regulatory domain-containing protein [Nonlabens sp. Ci31]QJP34122.1 carboxypeptidase-like regulatory domain-containing protein [Nonlabens sp. Ci31]